MRWIVYITAGLVVVGFIVGAIVGHLVTHHPEIEQSDEELFGADDEEPDLDDERAMARHKRVPPRGCLPAVSAWSVEPHAASC